MRIKSSPSNGPHLENFSVKLKETSREKLKENIYVCLQFSADNLIMRTGQEIAVRLKGSGETLLKNSTYNEKNAYYNIVIIIIIMVSNDNSL